MTSRLDRIKLALGRISSQEYMQQEWQRFLTDKIAELHKELGDRGIELMFPEAYMTASDEERYTTDEDRYERPVDNRRSR